MQESELRILACIYDQESVASLFSLLDYMNPTSTNPFKVFALYLVELVGRAAPVFIDHIKHNDEYWNNNEECIHNAINLYQEVRTDTISINFFNSVTLKRTMYEDICEIAMLNKVGFIILPFHKNVLNKVTIFLQPYLGLGYRPLILTRLQNAPCSVSILACKMRLHERHFQNGWSGSRGTPQPVSRSSRGSSGLPRQGPRLAGTVATGLLNPRPSAVCNKIVISLAGPTAAH